MTTQDKLADALRKFPEQWDRDAKGCERDGYMEAATVKADCARQLREALAEHDAKGDYDYALPIAEPIPIRPDDLWTCPLPEHWRRAIKERGIENPKALDWIEQRARELAQEGE